MGLIDAPAPQDDSRLQFPVPAYPFLWMSEDTPDRTVMPTNRPASLVVAIPVEEQKTERIVALFEAAKAAVCGAKDSDLSRQAHLKDCDIDRFIQMVKRGASDNEMNMTILSLLKEQTRFMDSSSLETPEEKRTSDKLTNIARTFIRDKTRASFTSFGIICADNKLFNGTSAARYLSFYNTIAVPHRELQIDEEQTYIHEVMHAQSHGFLQRPLNEGAAEYFMVRAIMWDKGVQYKGAKSAEDFQAKHFDELAARKSKYGPAYGAEFVAFADLVDIAGMAPVTDAYFLGNESGMEKALGNKWQKLKDFCATYDSKQTVDDTYNRGFLLILLQK